MKPSIIKAGISTTVTAAVTATLAGLFPVAATATPVAPEMAGKLAGKTVFLDPGHQGPNHSENLGRQVDNGRGGTKDCQTTGMTSVNGVPEHTINWNVAQLIKTSLESIGARVVLSRQDDSGWGGCVDDRARAANESGADVAVSIHADSAPPNLRGFHLIVPALPVPDAKVGQVQSGPGLAVTKAVRDAYLQAGFPAATYAGVQDGLQTRSDIAGPALTTVPNVFLEMGNGANAEDAALLESPDGQLKHAIAVTTGVVSYLLGTSLATTGSATDRPAAAPAQDVPAQAAPAQSVPAQAIPAQDVPAQPIPGEVVPAQAVPAPPVPNGSTQANGSTQDGSEQSDPNGSAQSDPNGTLPQSVPGALPQSVPNGAPSQSQTGPGTSFGTAPGSQSIPSNDQGTQANPSRSTPGTYALPGSPSTPGTQSTPGNQSRPDYRSGSESGTLGVLANTVLEMLMPLARVLGMDDTMITAELINLAYTLASTLFGPAK
ncbi:N-acetylmuramoyl-L-alanine amidase [Nocardia bhagyanarayanae]|uniref:N-acetylmuramoyl-L-alanine amidase n=1 Tax=Nocardia bhagyanarayanae TaxID=1215925 RepID=A0A543FBJ2_9NOCA|nr:N-acetylmuramoyl-L-alanine amidase [Nocardia bhagyanarayanae]